MEASFVRLQERGGGRAITMGGQIFLAMRGGRGSYDYEREGRPYDYHVDGSTCQCSGGGMIVVLPRERGAQESRANSCRCGGEGELVRLREVGASNDGRGKASYDYEGRKVIHVSAAGVVVLTSVSKESRQTIPVVVQAAMVVVVVAVMALIPELVRTLSVPI